jgi:Ceramidase
MESQTQDKKSSVVVTNTIQSERRVQMNNFHRKLALSFLITALCCAIFTVTMEVVLPKEGQWEGLESHHCDEFCENFVNCNHTMAERPTIQQPVNAYSNMAYIWCGIVPLVFLRLDLSTAMYFCSSLLLGISSFMFHASITRMWQYMDSAHMYTYILVLVMHGLYAVIGIPWRCLAPFLLSLFISMPMIRPKLPASIESSQINFAQVLFIALLSLALVMAHIYRTINHALARKQLRQLPCHESVSDILFQSSKIIATALIPAAFGSVATVGWTNDREKKWCDPDSIFQWHGVWVSTI